MKKLFVGAALRNKHNREWEGERTGYDPQEVFGKVIPPAGLTEEGVLFSYQPYEISCFAAGCFHFTIPYTKVKPYLTPQAVEMLGL